MCEVAECNGVQILNVVQFIVDTIKLCYLTHLLTTHPSQTCFMDASASKRAKEDDQSKKEKVQEENEAAKRLKEETAKKKAKLVEMLQNAHISRMSSLKGSAPKENGKPHHKSSYNGGSLSDNDDSNLSSTSSEEEKSESDVAFSG